MHLAIDGSHWTIPGGIRSYLGCLLPALLRVEPDVTVSALFRGRTASAAEDLPEGVRAVPVRLPRRLLDTLEHRCGRPRVERWTGPVEGVLGTHFSLPSARRGVPRVLVVHDVAQRVRPDLYDDPRGNDYGYRTLLPRSLARADRVIAISEHTKADLVRETGVDPDRVWVVPLAVDPRFAPATADEKRRIREALGLRTEFVLFPVGTVTPRKNVDGLLRAFADAFPDLSTRPALVLTGPKELPESTRARIAELGLELSVRAANVRYPDDLGALYSAARFGVYPSLYEGFGLPPLEAMACDLPMLVSNRTSCPEVVGDAALLVDPGNHDALVSGLRRMEDDAELREELRRRGRQHVEDPTGAWDRVARQTLAVVRDDRAAFEAAAATRESSDSVPDRALEMTS